MNMNKYIWILCGETSYERDDVICAYEDKDEAETEKTRLNLLLTKKPQSPSKSSSDDDWDRYDAKVKAWEKRFPGGNMGYLSCCDGFNVFELKLKQMKSHEHN